MKSLAISLAAGIALASIPATVQAQQEGAAATASASVEVGATVHGSDGKPVGTVLATQGDAVLLDTGANQIAIPATAFTTGEQGPALNITKAALDAEYERQMTEQNAKLDAALVVGAEVKTADAQPLGTVQAIEGNNVVLGSDSEPLTMPKEYFAIDQNGGPVVRATMAQIREAVAAASDGG